MGGKPTYGLHERLQTAFDHIKAPTGTAIYVYNLRREEDGQYELDFSQDDDIRLSGSSSGECDANHSSALTQALPALNDRFGAAESQPGKRRQSFSGGGADTARLRAPC